MSNRLFTFGKPAKGDGFTDREKETERLVSNFKYGINTFIVSPRRWGKTSLVLKAIDVASSDKVKPVFVDVFSCKNEEQFCERLSTAVLSQTAGKVAEVLENAKEFLSRITFEVGLSPDRFNPFGVGIGMKDKAFDLADVLALPQRIAEKKHIDIVVCIDEFQQIGTFPDSLTFQKDLRTAWQHQDNVTYCLFGSKKHMMETLFDDPEKPFYKFGDIMYLDCIPVTYWIKYIQDKFQKEGKSISKELCKKICETVEFNSSYIQQLAWYLFQETDIEANREGFESARDELIAQNIPLFESRTEYLTANQMNYLKAVSNGISSGLSSSHVISKYKLGNSANVAAAAKVLKRTKNVRFVMAGSGDMMTRAIRQVARLGISDRFHFTGFLRGQEVQKMFALSDVYIMPSVSEPFGISPLEAMRTNVPSIISKQSGAAEVLKYALKVDFWDVDALADDIYALVRYPALSEFAAKQGYDEVNNLKWNNATAKLKQVYESII